MRPQVETEFFDPPRPRVFAHRGASGDYPENTLPAFAAARDLGARYIELDVHMTRDGHVVVAHDDALKRVGAAAGLIREMTLAELSRVDAAYNFTPPSAGGGEFPFRGRASAYLNSRRSSMPAPSSASSSRSNRPAPASSMG
jgi:glycerophosphoryl diester phosphodiesterase